MTIEKYRPKAAVAAAIAALFASAVHATNLEPSGMDYGGTSFFDGFGPVAPGWAYLGYYQYSHADAIKDNSGSDVEAIRKPRIDLYLLLNQVAYTTDTRFFDDTALLGWTALIPYIHFTSSDASGSAIPLNHQDGIGDTTLGAYLQFKPVISRGRPVFSQRWEFDVVAPTGRYSPSVAVNPGAHFWSATGYWAATWLPTANTEASWRMNYLYNFSNEKTGLPATTSDRAGQAAWINFTASYKIGDNLNAGINGYYFQQLTLDRYNSEVPNIAELTGDGGKSRFLGIGPGVHWRQDPNNIWNFNLYFEGDARNHSQGTKLNAHWIHTF